MSKAAICVVVPVYKAMATLDRCVESVLAQQVEGGLTCILVDDGSPDESGALCDVWAAKDGRVTVIHQDDLGVSGARNSGLAAADSEFIVFLDSDDALRPGALQAALTAQRAAPLVALRQPSVAMSLCGATALNLLNQSQSPKSPAPISSLWSTTGRAPAQRQKPSAISSAFSPPP